MFADFPLIQRDANWHNCRVIQCEGRIVSHAALWPREMDIDGETFKVGAIASVATHPDFRDRGLAAAVVGALQDLMREAVIALVAQVLARHREESISRPIYHVRGDLADWAAAQGWAQRALVGSKGLSHEMIYALSPRLNAEVVGRLFVWGLDHV